MIDQALQLVFTLIARLIIHGVILLRPALPIICGVIAWALPAIILWNLFTLLRTGLANVRKLHRIPCARCQYATDNYHLKCSVRPIEAFSEQAIACPDFEANSGLEHSHTHHPSSSATEPVY